MAAELGRARLCGMWQARGLVMGGNEHGGAMKKIICGAALVLLGALSCALAGDNTFFLGSWTIARAEIAPWAVRGPVPDPAESKTLLGKTLEFEATKIKGPGITACPSLRYEVVQVPPEGLFQGSFEEMQRADKTVSPQKLASAQGFKPGNITSLQTGCANEIDYHFKDAKSGAFALNNYIFTIEKQ
jgi:hypothetical protein